MTPVLTLIEERVRALITERRGYTRHRAAFEVSLPVGVSVPNECLDPEAETYPDPIMGHTHDLSETGISLVLPSLHLGQERINAPDFPLRIVLSLPDGIVILQALTVRVEDLYRASGKRRYFVGARIKKMNERDRTRYLALLKTLS
jgi:hypothetical protein